MDTDKRIAKLLLDEQGFDVDEDRIHIPSKRCDMDLKRKTQLRNLLTAYRNEVCQEKIDEYGLKDKCDWCEFADDGANCCFDTILLRIENELWEG